MPLGVLPNEGAHKFAALADLARTTWAVLRGFPSRYQNTGDAFDDFSWAGHRGAYDDWTPISNQSVDKDGIKYGIDPSDNTPSASYGIPTMGYNRLRIFAKATGGANETLGVRAWISKDETANEAVNAITLATNIIADGDLRFFDIDTYLGPWTQIEAYAEGDYTLTAVTVTIHLWKE